MPALLRAVAALSVVMAVRAGAQFYAPDTQYHDKVQRLFVVEAARVLAWRENQAAPHVWEVAYKVKTDTNQLTTWDIEWLGQDGKSLNHFQVQYPEALLKSGPQFYRDILKQIQAKTKSTATGSLTVEQLQERFWAGAESTGFAREEGLRAALNLTQTNLDAARDAPALAGMLIHIPLPSLCGGVTLDGMLLARGAAWLALSETMLADPHPPDENWAPVLFLAGRENAACELWKSKVAAGQDLAKRPALFEWWDFFLRRPKARAAFEFAAGPRQRRFGMPMMTYYSRVQHLGTSFVEVIVAIYGRQPRLLQRFHNYGAFLAVSTSIGGGRVLEGAWPALFREDWLETLRAFKPSAQDYAGYREKLEGFAPRSERFAAQADDASLVGLKEFAPLLELGYEQGQGKLNPVAVASARDLLNYGWEMNGLQMGARYVFVSERWGVNDLAQTIFKQATRDLQGQAPFFPGDYQKSIFNLTDSFYRLQMVDDLAWRVRADVQPYGKDIADAAAARVLYQRCWLRPYEVRLEAFALFRAAQDDEALKLLQSYHQDCGRKSDQITMEYILDWSSKELAARPRLRALGEQLADEAPEPASVSIKLLYQKRYAALKPEARAQAYEKLFWQNPDSNLEQSILNGYIVGGAWKSAKRFYSQARDIVSREVSFSNLIAPQAWMMGFLDGDEQLMSQALEDSDTGSYAAMLTQIWHFAAHDDLKKMAEQIDELVERYEADSGPTSQGRLMKSFVPLIPALKDPKDPRHQEALDHFGKAEDASNLRWILIQKHKLSVPDAIRLLGGRETDRYRRVLIVYLDKQPELMDQAVSDYLEHTDYLGAGRVVASWAKTHLLKLSPSIPEKDLRPADVKSIEQAVLDKVAARQ